MSAGSGASPTPPERSEEPSAARSRPASGRSSSRSTSSLFGSRYDDVELLGRAVRNGPGWYPVGLAMHAQNGALFGAVYANVAPALPIPPALRGPAVALAEHWSPSWPLAALTDRYHPARDDLPALYRQPPRLRPGHLAPPPVRPRARRARAPPERRPEPTLPGPAPDYAINGHGSLERAVSSVR